MAVAKAKKAVHKKAAPKMKHKEEKMEHHMKGDGKKEKMKMMAMKHKKAK